MLKRATAEKSKATHQKEFKDPIITDIEPLKNFIRPKIITKIITIKIMITMLTAHW